MMSELAKLSDDELRREVMVRLRKLVARQDSPWVFSDGLAHLWDLCNEEEMIHGRGIGVLRAACGEILREGAVT